ncbi:MAG: hypothetical protein WC460_03445 [Patescibacteria group bacterium]
MKKFYKYFIIGVVILFISIIGIMGLLTLGKNSETKQINNAKKQAANYQNYKFASAEFNKLKRSESNDIYYYGADGKRYIFPTIETYKSWFAQISVADIMEYDLNKLYETPLGGNVTLRPGSLMQTPTDPNIYLVVSNGQISAINDKALLTEVYGADWQKKVINLENFYFTNYKVIKPINTVFEFPTIPAQITIDEDKGLK